MFEKDIQNIHDIQESIGKIIKYTEDTTDFNKFKNNTFLMDAVLMNIVTIGESVARLSDDFKDKHGHIEWTKIKGLRNIIAHDYFGVDIEEIWQIVRKKIPALKKQIDKILEKGV